jgi:hypothetical protein
VLLATAGILLQVCLDYTRIISEKTGRAGVSLLFIGRHDDRCLMVVCVGWEGVTMREWRGELFMLN